ncbi:MAG: aspartyl-tRNA(Asn)/glutamyl-tRNA(Gln) amidotransferase subunit, partial [Gaiellales bacterium]|nr:aspartyl-tRNA(Asn)/glutamyl-tRNA(Gln) amidotransferase subunit [Gaiellales bacterium]
GSKVLEGYRPPYTATVVRRCEAEGLVELGKTNMDEFAMGSSTENSAYGPTRNPWDRQRVPGGSSGGSAAAVAASMAPLALGTDTGGSIRQPAALCGVVGMKPTYGAVSRYGAVAFASSLDQIGPFARTVRDCALALRVIAGPDSCDSTCVGPPEPIELPEREDLRGVRVGAIALDGIEGVSPGVRANYEAALETVRSLGGELVEAKLEFSLTPHALAAYYLIAPAEASANLARYDGVRYGLRVEGEDVFAMYDATRERGFGREVKRRCLIGAYALSAGYYDAYYGQAQRVRTLIRRDFDQAFASCDLLLTPTAPTVAFKLGELVDDPLAMYACDLFTLPVNLSGLPAISLPSGLSEALPVGLHLAGPAFSENRLLAAAHALEGAFAFDPRPPALMGAA